MKDAFNVAVVIGSLRKASISRKVANALITLAPSCLDCRIIEIGSLSMYTQDLDRKPPQPWTHFRDRIRLADAVLFVTPEYNRSMPGVLKNALDIGSRPEGKNAFAGRAAAVVSVTPHKLGAFGANHALRQPLVYLDMPVMQQPEAYIADAAALFGDRGTLVNAKSRALFAEFMASFAMWITSSGRGASARSFEAFLDRREAIANAYANGDAAQLDGIVATDGAATFFPPIGAMARGAAAVARRYRKDARAFGKGSASQLQILQQEASGHIAWWTGYQTASVRMKGAAGTVSMKLRITESFRFTPEGWKLVHRHADKA